MNEEKLDKILEELKQLRSYLSENFWDIKQRIPTEQEKKDEATSVMNDLSSQAWKDSQQDEEK